MKINKKLRDIHTEGAERFSRLADEVKKTLKPRVDDNGWFFLCRIKELESFALKMETGRVPDPKKLEDFFACTIVVPTIPQIEQAENLARDLYDFCYRKPPSDQETPKASSSFAFDDLRLYVAQRSLASGRFTDLDGLVFEIQIKTILQHAWTVATHDLIYKSNTVSWPRERIAYQVKAMLEHAEIAIAEASRLAEAPAVAKSDKSNTSILRIIEIIQRIWTSERLPEDVKRLAANIYELSKSCDLTSDRLPALLEAELNRVGIVPSDLSPYEFVVQALVNSSELNFERKFNRRHIRMRLVIHDGMDLPEWLKVGHNRIIILG